MDDESEIETLMKDWVKLNLEEGVKKILIEALKEKKGLTKAGQFELSVKVKLAEYTANCNAECKRHKGKKK